MPWKESSVLNERMNFIARLQAGERMTDLCREFGIARKTGYKVLERFEKFGPEALFDRSRKPKSSPHRVSEPIEQLILNSRRLHPTWGARKLRSFLAPQHPGVKLPVTSTIGEILKRQGLIKPRRRRRSIEPYTKPLLHARGPNDVWCADFKGQFRLGNGQYCYPLTVTDAFSRYIIACVALESTETEGAKVVFEQAFRDYGMPAMIRTDNGTPFATTGLAGLSKLSAWWLRLGIRAERIEPAHPEQNGRHERMHLTLKQEATRPASGNILQQQERFDDFVHGFNHIRPHEALGDVPPASVYKASARRLENSCEPTYPLHDKAQRVYPDGHLRIPDSARVWLASALGNQLVGLREVNPERWLVTFVDLDLGIVDAQSNIFYPGEKL